MKKTYSEMRLTPQPIFETMKKLNPTLDIVKDSILSLVEFVNDIFAIEHSALI